LGKVRSRMKISSLELRSILFPVTRIRDLGACNETELKNFLPVSETDYVRFFHAQISLIVLNAIYNDSSNYLYALLVSE